MPAFSLYNDAIQNVLSYLELSELAGVASTSKQFKAVAYSASRRRDKFKSKSSSRLKAAMSSSM
jgi:hypothetical protein